MACIMAIVDQVVPPTINHEHVDDQLDNKLNLTLNQAQKREVRAALSYIRPGGQCVRGV